MKKVADEFNRVRQKCDVMERRKTEAEAKLLTRAAHCRDVEGDVQVQHDEANIFDGIDDLRGRRHPTAPLDHPAPAEHAHTRLLPRTKGEGFTVRGNGACERKSKIAIDARGGQEGGCARTYSWPLTPN